MFSQDEKVRATKFLGDVELLDDIDWEKELSIPGFAVKISDRVDRVPLSKTVGNQQKEIFGLADSIPGMATVTSNQGFVRALAQSGVHLHVLMHDSRALLTNKYNV